MSYSEGGFEGLVRPRLCEELDATCVKELEELPAWMRPLLAHRRSAKFAWVQVESLPELYDRELARLPEAAKRALLQSLHYTTRSSAHSSVRVWQQLLEPSSAGRFAEALVKCWANAAVRDDGRKWAVWAGRVLGDTESLATAAMIVLSTTRTQKEVELLLDLLLGSGVFGEVLLSVLSSHPREEIAEQAASKVYRAFFERTRNQWDFSATDFLEEHEALAHAFGVDVGRRDFSLDGDTVSVVLDAYGVPSLLGSVGDGMPPAHDLEALKRFDADPEALALWFALESLEQLVSRQAELFERLMSERAMWSWDAWRAIFLENRTFASWSLGVLWCAVGEDGEPRFFRVCEDQTLANIEDEAFVGEPHFNVLIAHPMYLTRSQRTTWMELFASYELVAPFDQLGSARESLEWSEVMPMLSKLSGKSVDIRALRKKRWKLCVITEVFSSTIPQTNIATSHMLRVIHGEEKDLFIGIGFQQLSGSNVVIRTFLRSGGVDNTHYNISPQDLSEATLLRLTEALRDLDEALN